MEEEVKEPKVSELLNQAKGYIDTKIEYAKLTAIEKGSKTVASLITDATVALCFTLAFLFGTFTFALYLSALTKSFITGFGIMSLIYILLALIIYLMKERFIEKRLITIFIKKILSRMADDEEEEKV